MILGDVLTRVRDAAGDIDALQFKDETVLNWINDACTEIVLENSFNQVTATVDAYSGNPKILFPTNLLKLYSIFVGNRKIDILNREEFDKQGGASVITGTELKVVVPWAGYFELYPAPTAYYQFTVNYIRSPDVLTSISGSSLSNPLPIPVAYHTRVVAYCIAQVAMQDDDINKYQMLMDQFKSGVVDLAHMNQHTEELYPTMSISAADSGWFEGY